MSNQLQLTGGAKVRDLQDVIIGTSGVLSSLGFDVANGVPRLDSNGKILVSQLPNSVMEYKGTWNAATNTPTLANGTGNQGDVYLCNVAGTVNFGAGPIAFIVGDSAVYSGSIWQRSGGATGSVTSVGLSTNGGAITIGNSPITTSGVISANFNGTNLQYVNGAGNLTTFPTLITSIGLSMPSAFSVANSPLTANGTIAVTGAGTTAQYIRGDGSLATFPTIATEAQRLITEVYNETGATLTKGTVVYINGGHGNLPTITKAIATGDATSAQTYGIVQTDITNMNNGYVVVIGSLGDLDTQAYANGTQLYLSSTVAGAWTSVKQYAPAHLVYVAIVTRSHPTQGVVEVRIQNGFEMDELHNVSAQTPLNNQGLFYNTSTSLWENKSIATALGYTPANDSLVVHLAGTETITGIKTFSNGLNSDYIGVTGDISMDGSFSLKQVAYGTLQSGYTNLSGQTNGLRVGLFGGYNALLNFSTSGSYTYTFPSATGIIALTSDIPSLAGYVTLATTQTITGAKTFSGAVTLTSSVTTNNLTFANSGFFLTLQPPTLSVNRTVTLPNGTGTLALTSDISYPVTSVFGRTGAVVATEGDYSLTQLSDVTITTPSSGQVLRYSGTAWVNSTETYVGTVTSVAALTIGTSGSDLSSTVANSTTTPVITLNVPTASATNRGALSSADWTTFNNKQSALTNPVTGTGTTNYLPKFTGTSTIGNSLLLQGSNNTLSNVFSSASGSQAFAGMFTGQGASGNTGAMYFGAGEPNGVDPSYPNVRAGLKVYQSWNGTYTDVRFDLFTLQGGVGNNTVMTGLANGNAVFNYNLGLGVTPANFTTYPAFQIGRGSLLGAGNDINITTNGYFDGGWKYISTNSAGLYNISGNIHSWYTAPSGTAGNAISLTQAMTLTASGRLLIGTPTEASYLLDVNGTGRFSGNLTLAASVVGLVLNDTSGSAAGSIIFQNNGTQKFNLTTLATSNNFALYNNGGTNSYNLQISYSTGAATFSSSVTATSFEVGNGQYYTARRSSGNLLINLLGIESGTDNTRIVSTNDFNIVNGSLVSQFKIAASGAATFSSSVTATSFFESSSIKGKDIIATNPLLSLDIDVIKYTRKSDESKDIRYGYSAEQIHSLMPELTDKDVTAVKYLDVHTILISQLQQEIKELKAKMN